MPDSQLGNQWRQLPGRAVDIGVGGDGSIWITGPVLIGTAGDFGGPISRFNGDQFVPIAGAGNRISVYHDGSPIISNTHGDIYWWVVDHWEQLAGTAIDVGAGGHAHANYDWIVGTEPTELGGRVYRMTRPYATPFNCPGFVLPFAHSNSRVLSQPVPVPPPKWSHIRSGRQ